jgi:hypothetical protein
MKRQTPAYTRKQSNQADSSPRQLCRVLYLSKVTRVIDEYTIKADRREIELIDGPVAPEEGDWIAYIIDAEERMVCLGRLIGS